jgi:hypothetical protein
VTQTEEVRQALSEAALEWPGLARSELVARLLSAGAQSLEQARERRADQCREALEASAGSLRGAYPAGYLETLRAEWPA